MAGYAGIPTDTGGMRIWIGSGDVTASAEAWARVAVPSKGRTVKTINERNFSASCVISILYLILERC